MEQQAVTPTKQNIIVLTQQHEKGEEQIEEYSQSENPEYAMTKENKHVMIESLTDQEKEEYYEFNLHISTFTSRDTSIEERKTLQIENVPTE